MKVHYIAYFVNGLLMGVSLVTLCGLIYRVFPVLQETLLWLLAFFLISLLAGLFIVPVAYRTSASVGVLFVLTLFSIGLFLALV